VKQTSTEFIACIRVLRGQLETCRSGITAYGRQR